MSCHCYLTPFFRLAIIGRLLLRGGPMMYRTSTSVAATRMRTISAVAIIFVALEQDSKKGFKVSMIIHKKRKRILCKNAQELSLKLYDFIDHVSSVQEESMTEYLIWQWEILNAKVKFFKHRKLHTKIEEAKSGADFELELWILDEKNAVPFIIQAKKVIDEYNSYCQKSLNYNNKKRVKQYQLLIKTATTKGKAMIPLYMFYTKNTKDKSIYIADAYVIKKMAEACDRKSRSTLSRDEILDVSHNIIDLFCFSSSESRRSAKSFYRKLHSNYMMKLENLDTQKYSYIHQYLKQGTITDYDRNIVIVNLRQIQ